MIARGASFPPCDVAILFVGEKERGKARVLVVSSQRGDHLNLSPLSLPLSLLSLSLHQLDSNAEQEKDGDGWMKGRMEEECEEVGKQGRRKGRVDG